MTTLLNSHTIRLDPRENGPEGMSNGGFAAGTFAGLVGGTARVSLRATIPPRRGPRRRGRRRTGPGGA